jgi:hypothetical protein
MDMNMIMKESEMKELLERVVREYLVESKDYVNEDGILDWDGDGSNVGIERSKLMDDFVEYINSFIW